MKGKAKAENWFATKVKHQEKLCNKAATKVTTKRADALAQDLESVINLSDRLYKVLTEDPDQFNRHILQYEEQSKGEGKGDSQIRLLSAEKSIETDIKSDIKSDIKK